MIPIEMVVPDELEKLKEERIGSCKSQLVGSANQLSVFVQFKAGPNPISKEMIATTPSGSQGFSSDSDDETAVQAAGV